MKEKISVIIVLIAMFSLGVKVILNYFLLKSNKSYLKGVDFFQLTKNPFKYLLDIFEIIFPIFVKREYEYNKEKQLYQWIIVLTILFWISILFLFFYKSVNLYKSELMLFDNIVFVAQIYTKIIT